MTKDLWIRGVAVCYPAGGSDTYCHPREIVREFLGLLGAGSGAGKFPWERIDYRSTVTLYEVGRPYPISGSRGAGGLNSWSPSTHTAALVNYISTLGPGPGQGSATLGHWAIGSYATLGQ